MLKNVGPDSTPPGFEYSLTILEQYNVSRPH